MEMIDFHTHYVNREMLNPTWLNFLEAINPQFYSKIDDYGKRPDLFAAYLKTQGVKYAVVLAECAPATSGNIPTEKVIEYCRDTRCSCRSPH